MRKQQRFQWDKISLGVCYYPEHWNKNLWSSDLRRMRESGLETVRVAEFAWGVFEPQEGSFQFDLFDAFLTAAAQEHMKVIFCTPTSIPPVWLTEAYPEVLNCRKDGIPFRHGMRRHYNYNSPTLHKLAGRIVKQVAKHYADHPCIIGWQIDNEFNCEIDEYYSDSDTLAFRIFLQEKYQTLDTLNKAWGTIFWNQTYTSWEQIYVPRTTINDMTNPHQQLDYFRFISESTIRFCKMQSDILHCYKKEGDFITTNGMFSNLDNHRLLDDSLDVYCYDSYPNFAFALKEDPLNSPTLNDRKWSRNLMEVRSICPHFGILEQQSGANGWNTQMETPAPKPGQMMLWTMQSILHGADYVSYFRWRTSTMGTEMYWRGILDYDNKDNRRLAEVRKIHDRVKKMEAIAGASYHAEVGLVKDYDNVFDSQIDVWHGRIARASEMEIFVSAQQLHTPLDAVYLTDSSDAGSLVGYKVLIYPHGEILTKKHAQILEAYVRQGGCLILGACTGQKDITGKCCMTSMPGLLSAVTHTLVTDYTLVGPADGSVTMTWKDRQLETGLFNDILQPADPTAKVLACYDNNYYKGKPALIETHLGNGRILHYGGTFTRDNVCAFLTYTGAQNPLAAYIHAPETCEIGIREKDGHKYLFVLNYQNAPLEIVLKTEMTDLDTGSAVHGQIVLEAFGTKVFHIFNND